MSHRWNISLPSLAILIFISSCHKVPVKTVQVWEAPQSYEDEETLVIKSGLARGSVGYVVIDPKTWETETALNEYNLFIPASTTKIITILAALDTLGPDYRFKTILSHDGYIKGGVLHGNIYLKGTGDPFITTSDLMIITEKIEAAGIKKVQGKFIVDDSYLFKSNKINPALRDDFAYNAGISSISSEFNVMEINSIDDGGTIKIFPTPSLPHLKLLRPDNPSDEFIYNNNPEAEEWFYPTIFPAGEERLPVKNPAIFVGWIIARLSEIKGIALPAPVPGSAAKKPTIIHTRHSLPLIDLAGVTLEYSNNVMAELIMLAAAKKMSGKTVNINESAGIVAGWLKKTVPGVDWNGFFLENGSGLSSKNRISPNQLAGILKFALKKRYKGRSILTLLPVSGMKGTLKNRMTAPDSSLKVWAKTGTMYYGVSLAGYFFDKTGEMKIFAIMMSDDKKRAPIDENMGKPKDKKMEIAAEKWLRASRMLEDNLVTAWINKP